MAHRPAAPRHHIVVALALTAAACAPLPDASTDSASSDTGGSTGAAEQPFSAELVGASLDSIAGCSVSTQVHIRIRVTAPGDRAIDAATLTSASFTGWWADTGLQVAAEGLPVAAGATAELVFFTSFDGDVVGVSDCGNKALPSPPVVATFEVDGEKVELAGSGSLGCGFDEPPDSGC